ncbi:MAG: rod shape-determining protein MreC [Chloroflexi bacterium]|nr:rod shape-determining protein MreC [Chloroflexota bacterium]
MLNPESDGLLLRGQARARPHGRRRALLIIALLGLILAWLILDQTGGPNPVRDVFSQVISPVQFALTRMMRPVDLLIERARHLSQVQLENEALRQENIRLQNQIVLLREAQIENETLREQLRFKSAVPHLHLLAAEVIGYDPSSLLQYLIIDRGTADGVQQSMPVLTAEGLVGRISEASLTSSKVMLITDPSSSVSAVIQRSRATGIVQGYAGQELRMRYIPSPQRDPLFPAQSGEWSQEEGLPVMPGDVVLTSGLGGNFPRRLLIGQVASVEHRAVDMFQEARVVPAVNLRGLESVMVLQNFVPEPALANE